MVRDIINRRAENIVNKTETFVFGSIGLVVEAKNIGSNSAKLLSSHAMKPSAFDREWKSSAQMAKHFYRTFL